METLNNIANVLPELPADLTDDQRKNVIMNKLDSLAEVVPGIQAQIFYDYKPLQEAAAFLLVAAIQLAQFANVPLDEVAQHAYDMLTAEDDEDEETND